MAATRPKINDSDVQLYLLGELKGDKASYISRIDAAAKAGLKSKMDKEIKSTLSKIRNVDNMLQSSADGSYSMPADLENKISSILASKAGLQKKIPISFGEKLRNYFTASNLWSLAGGGAVASLCMVLVIQIQPDILIDPRAHRAEVFALKDEISSLERKNERNYQALRVEKAEELRVKPSKKPILADRLESLDLADSVLQTLASCSQSSNEWIVTEELLIQIPICSSNNAVAEKIERDQERKSSRYLRPNSEVESGEVFYINVLPLKDGVLTIDYRNELGKVSIINGKEIKQGQVLNLPEALAEPYEFEEMLKNASVIVPHEGHRIIFTTGSGYEYSISFEIK